MVSSLALAAARGGYKRALVRAAMRTPYGKRARTAYAVGRHVYHNAGRYRAAASRIAGAYRRYKSYRARAAKSEPPRAKAYAQITPGGLEVRYRQLAFEAIEWASRTGELGEREGSTVFLKGIRICEQYEWTGTEARDAIEMHFALVQLRCLEDDPVTKFAPKFFRDNSSKGDKSFPFTNASGATTWDFRYNCLGINPDQFQIITHRKKTLFRATTDRGRWIWKINKYFKIKKCLHFDDDSDILPNKPFYVVFWWNYAAQTNNNARDPLTAPVVRRSFKHVQVFRTVNP